MKRRGVFSVLLAFLTVLGVIFSLMPSAAFAADLNFDNTDVLDDLKSSTADGAFFDLKAYPFNEGGQVQIINVTEYCYSYKANMRDKYALYLYVYNPEGINFAKDGKGNKVQMAVSYNEDGNPLSFEKFTLECVSVSEGDCKNLFYKFKVIDRKVNETTFSERVNSMERRYDISGIELVKHGEKNAAEYSVGGRYTFSGYAEGYGPDPSAKSTLSCTVSELETLSLSVHHTNYRTNVSSLGKNHYNEVNTVYFSVPERIFTTYGSLQKIHAEWWEYKTKPAAVTSNEEFYNELKGYVGTEVGEYNESVPVRLYTEYVGTGGTNGSPLINSYGWTYNVDLSTKYTSYGAVFSTSSSERISNIMPYAFYSPAVNTDAVFNYLYSAPAAGNVDGTVIADWIYNYKNNLGHGYVDCNGRTLSKDLFEDSVDSGRRVGYNNVNVDLADTFDLRSYDSNHSWWNKLWDYGFSCPPTDGDYTNVVPIYELKSGDLSGTDEEISAALLIGKNDVSTLKAYYTAETAKGNKVILFRFASTDYYSAPAFRSGFTGSIDNTDTYIAQQTVFFDFDIIDLTFCKDGVFRVIPAVSSPTDIINGFTPPASEFAWWKVMLAVFVLIILVAVLFPIVPYIVRLVIWIIMLPIKAIAGIFKAIKRGRKKKHRREEET